jgi:predicted transcriptional regulator
VVARPGAAERLAALRENTLAEIGLFELRRALDRSQTELAAELGISQPAISQLERAGDVKPLRNNSK